MAKYDLVVAGGEVLLAGGDLREVDVAVRDGRIVAVGAGLADADETVDAGGLTVIPGLVDEHFHSWWGHGWDTHLCATRAAAKGGVTSIVEMPLDVPLTLSAKALEDKRAAVDDQYYVDHAAFGGYLDEDPDEMDAMAAAGVVAFKLFTGDVAPPGVFPGAGDGAALDMMRHAAAHGLTLVCHCENAGLVEFETARLRREGRDGPAAWNEARPWFAEVDTVQRMALLSELTGCRVVIAHVPSPSCTEVIRDARRRGVDIWAETCPHLICIAQEDMGDNNYFKWNPPTRQREAVERQWALLRGGHVHTVGSDQAPLPKTPGASIWDQNPGAGNVLETMLPVFATEALYDRELSLARVVELLATVPAKLFNLYPRKGAIQVGADADLVLVDLHGRRTIDSRELEFHREDTRWSPYDGREVRVLPVRTILRGRTIYAEGEVQGEPGGEFLTTQRASAAV